MRIATAKLESVAPYSASRYYLEDAPKLNKELPIDYERRTWMYRLHVDEKGNVFFPPMMFKNCLSEAAKFLSEQIPGKGKSTWTKHFEAGVLVTEKIYLGIHRDAVDKEWLFVPSDGIRGSGKRVSKCFPLIHSWKVEVPFLIVNNLITEETFAYHLEQAGSLIGVGRFRPRNNGYYGRFIVKDIRWSDA